MKDRDCQSNELFRWHEGGVDFEVFRLQIDKMQCIVKRSRNVQSELTELQDMQLQLTQNFDWKQIVKRFSDLLESNSHVLIYFNADL